MSLPINNLSYFGLFPKGKQVFKIFFKPEDMPIANQQKTLENHRYLNMMKAKKADGMVELVSRLSSLPTRKLNLNIGFQERNIKIPT